MSHLGPLEIRNSVCWLLNIVYFVAVKFKGSYEDWYATDGQKKENI